MVDEGYCLCRISREMFVTSESNLLFEARNCLNNDSVLYHLKLWAEARNIPGSEQTNGKEKTTQRD